MKRTKHAKLAILWSTPNTLMFWSTPSTQIFWSTPSTPFHEARQACKPVKHASTSSTPSTRARQAREHAKHVKHTKDASAQAHHLADSTFFHPLDLGRPTLNEHPLPHPLQQTMEQQPHHTCERMKPKQKQTNSRHIQIDHGFLVRFSLQLQKLFN